MGRRFFGGWGRQVRGSGVSGEGGGRGVATGVRVCRELTVSSNR